MKYAVGVRRESAQDFHILYCTDKKEEALAIQEIVDRARWLLNGSGEVAVIETAAGSVQTSEWTP